MNARDSFCNYKRLSLRFQDIALLAAGAKGQNVFEGMIIVKF